MPGESRDCAWLQDMLDALEAIQRYTAGKSRSQFESDELLRDAVERRLEIVGEAACGLSSELRDRNPDIPWRKVIALRNVLIHDYGTVSTDLLWDVVVEHGPALANRIRALLGGERS